MHDNETNNIPIYWINLQHRHDRRRRLLKEELNGLKNPHVRITPKPDVLGSHVSCCKSHYEAILTAWFDGSEMALIIEDDVIGLKDMILKNKFFNYLVTTATNNNTTLHDEWNIIQLHYISPGLVPICEEMFDCHHLAKGYLMGAACYLISRRGMFSFLNKMSTPKFKNWLLNFGSSSSVVSFNEEKIGCTFYEGATPEEFVYGHFDDGGVFFSIFPLVNTLEKVGGSNLERSLSTFNYENMIYVNFLNKRKNICEMPFSLREVIDFPENVHWVPSIEEAQKLTL